MRAILDRVMLYTGIDYHQYYPVVSAQDATGVRIGQARIDENEPVADVNYTLKVAGLKPDPILSLQGGQSRRLSASGSKGR